MSVDTEKLFFSSVEQHRGWYLEKFDPPNPGYPFATLYMDILDGSTAEKIAVEMEVACERWYAKYPIPIMVLCGCKEDTRKKIIEFRGADTVTGFSGKLGQPIEFHWGTLKNAEFPARSYANGILLSTYDDISMKTSTRTRREADNSLRQMVRFKWLIVTLTIFLPAAWFVYTNLLSPRWVAVLIVLYGLFKSVREFLVRTGRMKRTEKEIDAEKRRLKELHYFHHCELNPDGFQRLKLENFQKESKERDAVREKRLLETSNSETEQSNGAVT